ncbi:hypothetical protein Rhopal_007854-T1 [Rhodotorula paludigena]|uniref:Oligopeptide transporter n=1 Tax=Rhodotorula paludigena TaxID=86838 RepID=A0AAV5H0K1_9BASI|nr:hypothetical protein Rhopal_007854-T1 [Rhodotorula paludigena]
MSDSRPKTASRPRTARPPTSAGQAQQWPDDRFDEEEDEEDDDVGMFSFMRPATGDAAQSDTPSTSAPYTPHSPSSPYSHPYSPFQFGFAAYGSVPPSTAAPSEGARPTTSYGGPFGFAPPGPASPLSPAAAYAHQVQSGESASPTAPLSPEPQPGPRKRGSWQSPDSPNHVVGNPYEERLRHASSRRTSDGSSRDKIDALGSGWADQPVSFAVDETGQAIMLDEMGHPLRTATTREQKMLAATDLGAEIPYSERPDDESTVEDDSPYPEVRASVSNYDDLEMPALTFRSWLIGLLFCIVVSAANTFFALRYPAPIITPVVTQVLSYPFGKLLARALPYRQWTLPRWTRFIGMPEKFSFNPGPFNIKEHTILVIMANISTSTPNGLHYSLAAEKGYGVTQSAGFDILLILSTQTLGFGAAGLCRRFLVWPAAMIWPQNLVFCTLLNTLHAEVDDEEEGPSRFRFFLFIIGGAFAWYWLPGFLFTALSAFSWVCWISPNNAVVNQLFGVSSGLGMGLITFDWSQISYIGSPLVVPWWAEVNIFVAFVCAFWIIAPIMYYTNVWDTAYLPISTSGVFDRYGQSYDTSLVVDSVNMRLNETAYQEYSPLFLPITYATAYGVAFMLAIAVIVHTVLYNGKEIWQRLRRVRTEDEDVHMRLMKAYPEVPDWWYLGFLAIAIALSIITIACWDTFTPVWSVIVAIVLGFIYLIPGGFIFALTTNTLNINLIVQLIAGYIMPGRPLANMLFKVYSIQTLNVGLYFSQDLKLGHYMKISPRSTFSVQVVATVVTAFVQVGVKRWLNSVVPDLCDGTQSARLVCPAATTYYSASIIWGLIGPSRQFGVGHRYNPILYWMVGGALLPLCTWLLARRYPSSWVKYINIPVGLAGLSLFPPATGINWSSWFFVGFIFQFLMRRRHFDWWSKYNFVLSAGLDAGTVVAALVIFFALQLPKGGSISLDWWGNNVYTRTLDWLGNSYKTPPETGFGPSSW